MSYKDDNSEGTILVIGFFVLIFCSIFLISQRGCGFDFESEYEKCKRYYIDKKGYSYDEACDECEAVKDLYGY